MCNSCAIAHNPINEFSERKLEVKLNGAISDVQFKPSLKVEICVNTGYNKYISHLKFFPQILMTRDVCTLRSAQPVYRSRKMCKKATKYLTKSARAV